MSVINNFKHLSCFLLAIIMIVSMAGCRKDNEEIVSSPSSNLSSSDTSSNTSDDLQSDSSSVESNSSSNASSTVTDTDRPYYKPTSLTVSFYDTASSSYGFTWNTEAQPIEPVIQICEGSSFNKSKCKEFKARVTLESVKAPFNSVLYICKTEINLKQNTTYTYRAYDKGAKIGTDTTTFKTSNFKSSDFSFVHVSDSQVAGNNDNMGEDTGVSFGATLSGILEKKPSFLLHTGDIVEYSVYETYWKNMLDYNAKYLMKLPFMPLSGNHETTYRAGKNEVFKHFNIKTPKQETELGFYYAFDYGDVKFIMLNTNRLGEDGLESAQYNWLVNTLKSNNKKWTIVSMHHPMYSVGKWGADPAQNVTSLKLRKQLSSLFAENKVDLVLQGHDHTYSKTYPIKSDSVADTSPTYETVNSVKYTVNPKGTIYSMHGPAGDQKRSPYEIDKNLFEMASESKTNSWAEINVKNDRLTVKIMYYSAGKAKLFDSYGIIKK